MLLYKPVEGEVLRIVIFTPLGQTQGISITSKPDWSIQDVKKKACRNLNLDPVNSVLSLHGRLLGENITLHDLGVDQGDILSLIPKEIKAGVDEQALVEEYRFIRQQFPLVKMDDLLTYTGRLRCERGYVKELADKGVWPFTEYVQWHEFKMVLSYLHPYKPPTVTWLTDISHPNIIPKKKGKVCVSVLGKKWLPNTKLAAVINALYFLLSDPNPYSAYPNKRCKEVAKICRMFGFPLKRKQVTQNIIQVDPI
jgi:hypothetical protein